MGRRPVRSVTPLLPARSSVQRIVGTEAEALDRFGEPDILHDNGIWLPHNHRLAVLAENRGLRRVVSTRGMLEPWALSHKRFKKKLAWWVYQRHDLKRARCHIATGEAEARNLHLLGLGVPIVTVPNGVDVPEERPGVQFRCESVRRWKKNSAFPGSDLPHQGPTNVS